MSSGGNLLKGLDYSVLQQCMHCGLCLPVCPTFAETKRERHGPRGRIALMRAVADDELPVDRAFAEEMSYCLGCLACTSACPAGVDYGTLVETAKAEVERRGILDTPLRGWVRKITLGHLFVHPRQLRRFGWVMKAWQKTGAQGAFRGLGLNKVLPGRAKAWERATPVVAEAYTDELVAEVEGTNGPARYRVLLLSGCMQDLLFADINRATADVLLANGCEVHTPREQGCCGSIHAHNGDLETARRVARNLLERVRPEDYDAIISNAGGCGSHLRHYGPLLKDDPRFAARAEAWDERVRDIHEWLVEIGFRAPLASGLADGTVVTYHDSCHLAHGQKVTAQPRRVLAALPGIRFVETAEATWCCGSAGVYSLTHPLTATELQKRKVGHLETTQATVVATANPGCHLQIAKGFEAFSGQRPRVVHPVVLLAEAYAAEVTGTV